MTNDQAALIAAATFCAPVKSGTEDVQRIAEKFLKWLERNA